MTRGGSERTSGSPRIRGCPDRRFPRQLAAITALGAVWRLGYLFLVKWRMPLQVNDSLYYSVQARRNLDGHWFRVPFSDLPGAAHGPLTVLYLMVWSVGGGNVVPWQRLGNTVLGIVTVALIGILGRRVAGPTVGLVAAGIAAIYPNLWVNDSVVMSESLAALLVVVAVLLAIDLGRSGGRAKAAVVGFVVGLAALTRSELALCVPAFAAVVLWRGRRGPAPLAAPALLALAAAVTLTPWTLYNLHRFERPVLLSTNDGATLLGANCDATYRGGKELGGWIIACLEPSELAHAGEDESQLSEVRRGLARSYVEEHPGRLPLVVAARLGRALDLYGHAALVGLDVGEDKAPGVVWAGIGSWWVLAVLAVIGWRALSPISKPYLAAPLLAVVATTVLFYGAHRIRAPAEPIVVVLAAAGLDSCRTAVRGRWAQACP